MENGLVRMPHGIAKCLLLWWHFGRFILRRHPPKQQMLLRALPQRAALAPHRTCYCPIHPCETTARLVEIHTAMRVQGPGVRMS